MKNFVFKILFVFWVVFMVCIPVFANNDNTDNEPRKVEYKYIDTSKYDVNDLTSFRALTKQFQKDFDKKRGTKEAEDAYLEIMDYYDDFVDAQNKKIDVELVFYENEFYKNRYVFNPFGMILWANEGAIYFATSNKYIYKNFAPYLSKEWQELLKYETYFDKIIVNDARYIIPKSEVKKIINFYSYFCKKYPEFSKRIKIDEIIKIYEDDLKHYPFL